VKKKKKKKKNLKYANSSLTILDTRLFPDTAVSCRKITERSDREMNVTNRVVHSHQTSSNYVVRHGQSAVNFHGGEKRVKYRNTTLTE
jgi:hypothetical protein